MLRGTTLVVRVIGIPNHSIRVNGRSRRRLLQVHRRGLSIAGRSGEFDLRRSAGAASGSHLALPARWRTIYYSWHGLSKNDLAQFQLVLEWTQGDSNPRPSQCH
jgi:hypothetical protein